MRIAIVTTSYPAWEGEPAGHFVAAEARALCTQGHDVTVVAPGAASRWDREGPVVLRIADRRGAFGPPGAVARLRENPMRAAGILEFIVAARQLLTRSGPFDLLIGHWLIPSAWPIGIGRAPRVEAVAHGSDVRLLARLPRLVRARVTRSLLEGDVTLRCVSESLRELLISVTNERLRPRTRVEPAALELSPARSRDEMRRGLGLGPSERLVVIVARLIASKRVGVALAAVARLPGVRVIVVGAGPQLPELQNDFPHVCFTGALPHADALSWIGAADVILSTSKLEGAPTVVREARGLGVPVVACPAGDLLAMSARDPGLWIVPPAPRSS